MSTDIICYSDARIKRIIGVSKGSEDLTKLMQLKVTDHTYRDTIANGTRSQKKLIAQEVEKVFPAAVNQVTNVVSDIMEKAPVEDGWIKMVGDLKKGERVKIMSKGSGTEEGKFEVYDVLEVKKDKFRTSFKSTDKDKEVYVYGREVKDFRTLDYDAISILNVSATQQIKKDSDTAEEALRKENEALRAKVTEMEKKIASTVQASTATEARLAALEKALSKEAKPAARTASLKAGE